MKIIFLMAITSVFVVGTLMQLSAQEYSPSGRNYVPYTENYNVSFNHDGNIDYDLLIAKIMHEMSENHVHEIDDPLHYSTYDEKFAECFGYIP